MKLDEFRAYVKEQRKASTLEAISKLTTKDHVFAEDLFDQDDLKYLEI